LRHLHLLQNCYTPSHLTISACGVKAWRNVKKTNPRLRVHLRLENLTDGEVVLQPEAPVHSITYCAPQTRIRAELLVRMVDHYRSTLAVYGHELLPRFSSPKPFHSRIDSLMLLMCRQCFNVDTLVSSVIFIPHLSGKSLKWHNRGYVLVYQYNIQLGSKIF